MVQQLSWQSNGLKLHVSAVRLCPEPFAIFGGCGEVVNASDCGSDTRGFDSLQPPHNRISLSGCSLMAKPQPSKLMLWVRFPSPAPFYLSTVAQWQSYRLLTDRSQVRILPVEPWLLGQAVKTPPFHGGNTGSSPVGVIQTEVKYRFCFFIIIFYHGELSELAEGARLESVQASQASRGFESLTLRKIVKISKHQFY